MKRSPSAVAQDAAFAAQRLGEQDAHLVDAGGMELVELHVLERDAAAVGDRDAIAGGCHGIGRNLEDAAKAARGQQDRLGVEDVDFAGARLPARRRRADAVVGQIRSSRWNSSKKLTFVLDALLVKRLEDHVAGAVGGDSRRAAPEPRRSCGCARRTVAGRSFPRACG